MAPGRATLIASSLESSVPTHSSTASAPPLVNSSSLLIPSSSRSATLSVAPNSLARAARSA